MGWFLGVLGVVSSMDTSGGLDRLSWLLWNGSALGFVIGLALVAIGILLEAWDFLRAKR
jgi:hypothetical protein